MSNSISTTTEINTPLLQQNHSVLPKQEDSIPQNGTISGAVFNISTTMVGAGIMSIPATMKVLGIIPGLIVILSVAVITDLTVEFMLRFTSSGKAVTYAGMVGDVLCGNEFNGTTHLGILQQWFGIHWWTCRAFALLIVALFIMLPLVMLRRVDSLKYSSALSIALALVFVVICSSMAFHSLWSGKTQSVRLFPDFSQVTALDLFTTVPVFVTGFGFHVNVHPIRAELVKPSDMSIAVRLSLLISVAIYFAIGFFGYLLFGDSIMPDVLINFDQNSDSSVGRLLDDIIRLSYALHLALVFPIMFYSLRANIDELLFSNKRPLALDTRRFVSLTLVLLAFTYFVAVEIPNVWYFFQFLGSTTIVCLSFLFPAAIILRDMHGISKTIDQVMATVVIILAVGTSGIAIWTNLNGSSAD
ncbi:unnamed protein product [Trifolium pratense]|uniref:Uncharacterized protein n=1 Tax=Trifolium pratense TaxID=57577 RepID=A0ACB0KB27_TRIPR|nr:unnamed protein product [Trifolium pratense]